MEEIDQPEFDVSVVIPARNEAAYVVRALESVAEQTWPIDRLEALVVDNGSSDGTADVVRSYAEAHPNLAVRSITEPIAGAARARNAGAKSASGRWLIFLDADSRMAPDLAEQVVKSGQTWTACSIRIIADSDDRLDRAFFDLLEFGKVLFRIRAQMFYCERSVFLANDGYNEELLVAEDKEFLTRLRRNGVEVGHLNASWIATSTRRLHGAPFRLGLVRTFGRWAMAQAGIGRRWRY
jgi:glycosyltransferase involved in cell wall biosynthesis